MAGIYCTPATDRRLGEESTLLLPEKEKVSGFQYSPAHDEKTYFMHLQHRYEKHQGSLTLFQMRKI